MKKISILFFLVITFFIYLSCEQQVEIDSLSSIETTIQIDNKSQIILEPTILSKDEIEKTSCEDPTVTTLFAGQHIDVGTITISNNESNLFVTYDVTGNWRLQETHLYVGSVEDIPLNGGENPKIGHFPYHDTGNLGQSYTFTVPLNFEDCFVIVAHAVVEKKENGKTTASETAFGFAKNNVFGGSRWGWYIDYCKQECDADDSDNDDNDDGTNDDDDDDVGLGDVNDDNDNNDGTDNNSDTCLEAFAYNPENFHCFLNDGFTQWGWSNLFTYTSINNGSDIINYKKQIPLYTNAEQCVITNGLEIGYIEISVSGSEGRYNADITYHITDILYNLQEVNLYIGSEKYPKDAENNDSVLPETYSYSASELNENLYSFTNLVWPANTYIIAHAKVCEK